MLKVYFILRRATQTRRGGSGAPFCYSVPSVGKSWDQDSLYFPLFYRNYIDARPTFICIEDTTIGCGALVEISDLITHRIVEILSVPNQLFNCVCY